MRELVREALEEGFLVPEGFGLSRRAFGQFREDEGAETNPDPALFSRKGGIDLNPDQLQLEIGGQDDKAMLLGDTPPFEGVEFDSRIPIITKTITLTEPPVFQLPPGPIDSPPDQS